MPSDIILELTNIKDTLTKAVFNNPHEEITTLAHQLYANKLIAGASAAKNKIGGAKNHEDYTQDDLDRAAKCGKFPYRPSDLFLKASRTLDTADGYAPSRWLIDEIDLLWCPGYPWAWPMDWNGLTSLACILWCDTTEHRLCVRSINP